MKDESQELKLEIERLKFDNEQLRKQMSQMHPKPSWDDAPEWANWLAQDRSGEWYWYVNKPLVSYYRWHLAKDRCALAPADNWQNTLEHRPEGNKQ